MEIGLMRSLGRSLQGSTLLTEGTGWKQVVKQEQHQQRQLLRYLPCWFMGCSAAFEICKQQWIGLQSS